MMSIRTRPDAPTGAGREPAPDPRPSAAGPDLRLVAPHLVVIGTALAAWAAATARVDVDALADTGLIGVLPGLFWVAGTILVAGFTALLTRPHPPALLALAYVAALVALLHATPGIVEAEARFPTAWLHAGYVDHIIRTGAVLPELDARFNWPGGFSFAALLATVAGVEPRELLRWTPLVVNLLFLLPVRALATLTLDDARARAAAPWLFVAATWVGQDYFAPQALAFLLSLTCVVVLLRWFRGRPDGTLDPATPASTRVALVGLLVVLVMATTVSHQLTPFMLVGASAVLVVLDRSVLRGFPVLVAVVALGWLSFGAEAYWQGHLDFLTGGVGDVGGIVDQNVGQRIGGNDARRLVLGVRMGLTGLVAALAAVGFLRSWRRKTPDWTVVALAASPLPAIGLQGYGGELFLRVWLFCAPFLALLAARAFFDRRPGRRARPALLPALAFGAVAVLTLPLFVTARYGNERFEMIHPADVRAVEAAHANAEDGATLLALNFAGPWRFEDLVRFDATWLEGGEPDVAAIESRLAEGDHAYLLLTRGQAAHGEIVSGLAPGWMDDLGHQLVASGSYCTVYDHDGATVLRWIGPSGLGCSRVGPWAPADGEAGR